MRKFSLMVILFAVILAGGFALQATAENPNCDCRCRLCPIPLIYDPVECLVFAEEDGVCKPYWKWYINETAAFCSCDCVNINSCRSVKDDTIVPL